MYWDSRQYHFNQVTWVDTFKPLKNSEIGTLEGILTVKSLLKNNWKTSRSRSFSISVTRFVTHCVECDFIFRIPE